MSQALPAHLSDIAGRALPDSMAACVQRIRELEQELADAHAVIAAQSEVIARRQAAI